MQARKQLAQAKAAAMPGECIKILEDQLQQEEAAMRQSQPLRWKMDRARARFRKAVMSGEKATETLQKAANSSMNLRIRRTFCRTCRQILER